jgi:hypothetical protein
VRHYTRIRFLKRIVDKAVKLALEAVLVVRYYGRGMWLVIACRFLSSYDRCHPQIPLSMGATRTIYAPAVQKTLTIASL